MASSDVEIINTALILVGEQVIANRNDANARAKTIDAVYDMVRKALLRRYRWNFAIKRETLALLRAYRTRLHFSVRAPS